MPQFRKKSDFFPVNGVQVIFLIYPLFAILQGDHPYLWLQIRLRETPS